MTLEEEDGLLYTSETETEGETDSSVLGSPTADYWDLSRIGDIYSTAPGRLGYGYRDHPVYRGEEEPEEIAEDEEEVDMTDPSQVQDLEAMRQLAITAQRELTEARQAQGAAGGTQQTRGVVLKLAAPSLDDAANYQIWKKRMRIWKGTVKADNWSDQQMATAVIALIHDNHKIKK